MKPTTAKDQETMSNPKDTTNEPKLTAQDFLAWHRANAEELTAKREAMAAERAVEISTRLKSFTDATIRVLAESMERGFSLNEACESILGNAFRFGACHETLNELVGILESLGWKPEVAC